MAYVVNDKRGKEPVKEVCRVCGASVVHSREYNKPTMGCIEHLRGKIAELEGAAPNSQPTAQV